MATLDGSYWRCYRLCLGLTPLNLKWVAIFLLFCIIAPRANAVDLNIICSAFSSRTTPVWDPQVSQNGGLALRFGDTFARTLRGCDPPEECIAATKLLNAYFTAHSQEYFPSPLWLSFGYSTAGVLTLLATNGTEYTNYYTSLGPDFRAADIPVTLAFDCPILGHCYASAYNSIFNANGEAVPKSSMNKPQALALSGVGAGGEYLSCGSWPAYMTWIIRCKTDGSEYLDTSLSSLPCSPTTVCGKGLTPLLEPGWSSDRVCTACAAGAFKDSVGNAACTKATTCTDGVTYESKAPTTSTDRVCSACCDATPSNGTWLKEPCSATKPGLCPLWSTCPSGTYRIKPVFKEADATCEPCQEGFYQDASAHSFSACKPVTATCIPGQRQSVEPWVNRNRVCIACDADTYQDKSTISPTCKPYSTCKPPLVEATAPTPTSDRGCRYPGSAPPTVTCPAARGTGALPGNASVVVPVARSDFTAVFPDSVNVTWCRSDLPEVGNVTDGVEADALLSTPVAAGTSVTVTYTVVARSNPSLIAACTTIMHVLRVTTVPTRLASDAALFASYAPPPLVFVIDGAHDDTVFSVDDDALPPGIEAEDTVSLSVSGDASARLRLLGQPTAPGLFRFNVRARSPSTGAVTVVNFAAFSIDVQVCRDAFGTCVNGKCATPADPYDPLQLACHCDKDFSPNTRTRLCTNPVPSLTLTCPCDLQLAVVPPADVVALPSWLTADAFVSSGDASAIVAKTFVNEDTGQPLDLANPLPARSLTRIKATALDSSRRQANCSMLVGVLDVWLSGIRSASAKAASPVSVGMAVQHTPTPEPLSLPLLWAGNLPSLALTFDVENMAALSQQGFIARITSGYSVLTLPAGERDVQNTTVELLVPSGPGPVSARYTFRVLAATAPLPGVAMCVDAPGRTRGNADGMQRRRGVGQGPVLPPDANLVYGSEALQALTLAVSAQELAIDVVDCLETNEYDTCRGGRCLPDENPFDGKASCDCSDSVLDRGADGLCSVKATTTIKEDDKTLVTAMVVLSVAFVGLILFLVVLKAVRKRRMWKKYHIFISYRVATDHFLAARLALALETSARRLQATNGREVQVRCFLDKNNLQNGRDWRDGFLTGLQQSCLFLPLVSEAGLAPIKALTGTNIRNQGDNVLLEYETALALRKQKRLLILPLLIGATRAAEYNFKDFGPLKFPALPSPNDSKRLVCDTMFALFRNQGLKLCDYDELPDGAISTKLVEDIVDTLESQAWGQPPPAVLSNLPLLRQLRDWFLIGAKKEQDTDDGCLQLWKHWHRQNDDDLEDANNSTTDSRDDDPILDLMQSNPSFDMMRANPSFFPRHTSDGDPSHALARRPLTLVEWCGDGELMTSASQDALSEEAVMSGFHHGTDYETDV